MLRNSRGTGYLLRANLKQNLKFSLIWIVILVMMIASGATKMVALFSGPKTDLADMKHMLTMPGMAGVFGAIPKSAPLNSATVFAGIMMVFMVILDAIYIIPLMVKDTRGQEESGLLEMVRARTVGRTAAVMAAVWELLITSAVLFVLYSGSLVAINLKGADLNGNILFGLVLALANVFFGSVALLLAQLASTAQGAEMWSYVVLTAAYLIRLVTDIQNQKLTWLSPIGWAQKTNAYTDYNYWPVLMLAVVALVLAGGAVVIARTRDLGTGILPERAGRARAAGWLRSVPALLLRTERGLLAGWFISAVLMGAILGSVLGGAGDVLKANPLYRKLLDVSQINAASLQMTLAYMAMFVLVFVCLAVVAGAQLVGKLKSDEEKGYLGIVHAEKPTRTTISLSYYFLGLIFSAIIYVVAIVCLYYSGNTTVSEPLASKYLVRMIMAGLPAVLAFVSLAAAIIGIIPRISGLFWVYMGVGLIVEMFGPILNLGKNAGKFSPFGWLNQAPVHALENGWLWTMLVIMVVGIVAGVIGYRERDVA